MSRSRVALAAAIVSLAALAAVRGGGGGPPLYDGICLPPHYLVLGASPGPSAASATYSAGNLGQTQELATTESTPQAQVIISSASLAPPPGQSTVTVTITPVKAPATKPSGGSIDGNVYELAARSGGQPVALAAGHPATVVLGATSSGGPQLTLERSEGGGWTALKTFQSGCGTTYEAASPSLGLFALVASGSSSPGTPGSPGGSGTTIVIVAVAILGVLALVIGAARLGRRRR